MNLIILIICAVTAYILTRLFDILNYKFEKNRKYKNDLYVYKIKKIFNAAYNCGLEQGFNRYKARLIAARFTKDVEKAYMVDVKFKLAKELENGYKRNKSCCQ